ncbi:MAG: hypothetical protein HZB41_15130 [Ignavibacteriae bacterium]|nr:hypothetical protein [Ignavibacteriota bacterium]
MIEKKYLYRHLLTMPILLILTTILSFANIVETVCFPDKIIIKINNLVTHTAKDSTGKQILYIDNINNTFRNSALVDYDVMHFNLALKITSYSNITFVKKELYTIGKTEYKNYYQLSAAAELVNIGIIRGVPVSSINIQPFEIDKNTGVISSLKSAEIIIQLNSSLTVSEPKISEIESGFFASIENKKHLGNFLNHRYYNKKNPDVIQSEDNWYFPDKTYIKLTTIKDGIAFLNGNDPLIKNSSFIGKQSKFLHLLYKGIEQPLYFINDNDGIFNESDKILFIGYRPIGDTTWFNVFSNENAFFLEYDETKQGDRFNLFPEVSGQIAQLINNVFINNRIEPEKIYSHGYKYNQIGTETVEGEGCFWDFITPWPDDKLKLPYEKETFTYSTLLNTDLNSSDSIKITLFIRSKSFLLDSSIKFHKIKSIINFDTIDTYLVPHAKADTIEINYPRNKLNLGMNKVMLKSFFTTDQKDRLQKPDDVWIDYAYIQGLEKPYAFKGILDFAINNLNKDSEVDTKGFNSDTIYVLDTLNKLIQFPKSERGSFVRATAVNGKLPTTNIIMNDSILCDSLGKGLHIGILRFPGYNPEYKLYTVFDSEVDNYLSGIPDSSIICLAYNSDEPLPFSTRKIIQDFGSKEINTRVIGQSWIFLVRKGNLNSVVEQRITSGTVQLEKYLEHPDGNSYISKFKLAKGSSYNLLCRDESSIEHANVYNVSSTNLRDTILQSDLIIITHGKFRETADSLANYREKSHNLKAMVVDVDDIYKEFNFGIKSPHAIKNFLSYAYFSWRKPAPAYLTLIGDACWDYRGLSEGAFNKDYIPSYGWPVSDHWYTKLDGDDYLGDIIIGRIPLMENSTGLKYIEKLKEYDSIPLRPWMKNFLFLSGGILPNENFEFWDLITLCSDNILNYICGDTITVRKRDITSGGEIEGPEIISKINSGAIWVSFFGHSAPTLFDMDGWNAYKLNNKPKYNFLTTWGCNTGAYSEPNLTCRNEEYLLEPERASIGVVGPSSAGIVPSDKKMMANLIDVLADSKLDVRQIGDIINYGISKIGYKGEDTTTVNQLTLLGDPLVKLKIKTQPDLYCVPEEIKLTNLNDENIITESDSVVRISGFVYNGGTLQEDSVKFRLIREFENFKDTLVVFLPPIYLESQFQFLIPANGMAGKHKLNFDIDPSNLSNDDDRSNNKFTMSFEVFSQSLVPLEPLPYWDMKAIYNFEIRDSKTFSTQPVYQSQPDEITDHETYIEWMPQLLRLDNYKPYWLVAYKKSTIGNIESKIVWIPFTATSSKDSGAVKYYIHGGEQLKNLQLDSLRLVTINDTARISFDIHHIPFVVKSVYGIPERDVEIQLNNKIYISTDEPSQAPIGFNIVVASGFDGSYKLKRYFDTWSLTQTMNGVKLVQFLKDSIDHNDYVLIATCGASLRLLVDSMKLNPKSIGSLDSLRYYLRQYGSKYADSITTKTNYDPNSFVMVGRWGSPVGSIPELLNIEGKVAQITDTIDIKMQFGHLKTPLIGPAKNWKSIYIKGKIDTSIASNTINIFGIPYDKNDYVLLIKNDTSHYIDLSAIPADEYPYIRLESDLERKNDTSEYFITSISSAFNPLPELTFVKDKCIIKSDSVMRGDSITFHYKVKNISARVPSDSITMVLSLLSENNPSIDIPKDLDRLGIDRELKTSYDVETQQLGTKTNVLASLLLDKNHKDIYTFNNSENRELFLIEDTIKPYIKVKLDGVLVFDSILVKDGEYISIKPKIEISLLDNSYIPVINDAIKVRINAKFIKPGTENEWKYNSFGNNRPLKATLEFISDSLDIGENIITIMYSDATGNKDTSRITVFVSLNGYVENIKNIPNPLDNFTTFYFYFKAPHQGTSAEIVIYDISGQKVATLRKDIIIGENKIDWEARNDYGDNLPIGVYFYRINILTDFYVDPYFGKFIIVR